MKTEDKLFIEDNWETDLLMPYDYLKYINDPRVVVVPAIVYLHNMQYTNIVNLFSKQSNGIMINDTDCHSHHWYLNADAKKNGTHYNSYYYLKKILLCIDVEVANGIKNWIKACLEYITITIRNKLAERCGAKKIETGQWEIGNYERIKDMPGYYIVKKQIYTKRELCLSFYIGFDPMHNAQLISWTDYYKYSTDEKCEVPQKSLSIEDIDDRIPYGYDTYMYPDHLFEGLEQGEIEINFPYIGDYLNK